jgi:hypothetical protein
MCDKRVTYKTQSMYIHGQSEVSLSATRTNTVAFTVGLRLGGIENTISSNSRSKTSVSNGFVCCLFPCCCSFPGCFTKMRT